MALLAAASAGCFGSGSGGAREAYLVDTLIDADRDLIALRPDLVARKYQLMGGEVPPQDFLRGTARLFYLDHSALAGGAPVLGGDDASALVWIYGDAHLENLGANFDADGMLIDCVDFDATIQAPFDWDVRRAALGLATGLHMAGRDDLVAASASALADGWRLGVSAPAVLRSPLGAIWDDLVEHAQEDLASRDELTRYTTLIDGRRRLLRDERDVDVPAPFADHLAEALAGYRQTRRAGRGEDAAFVLKDAVARLDSGVASLPNLRFWLLVEGPPGEDDDLLLELKEERDPPEPAALLGRGPVTTAGLDNAARIFDGTRALLASSASEPDLGWVRTLGVSFQVRSVSRGRRSLDIEDFVDGVQSDWSDTDVTDFARVLGRLLGAAHVRSAAASVLLAAAGPPEAFSARTAADAVADLDGLLGDYARFTDALTRRGPLLGAVP